jgi:hypothetical protein
MVDVDGGGLELVFGHRNGHISLVSSRRNSEGDIDLQLAGRPLLSGNNSDFTLINTLSRTSMSESVLFLTTGLTQLAIVPETWRQLWVLGLAEAVPDTRTVVASLGEGAAVSVHVDAEGRCAHGPSGGRLRWRWEVGDLRALPRGQRRNRNGLGDGHSRGCERRTVRDACEFAEFAGPLDA